MIELANLIFWALFGIFLSAVIIIADHKSTNMKAVAILSILFTFMYVSTAKRWEFFTAIESKPSHEIEFSYNKHKVKADPDGEFYLWFWVTRLDRDEELVYKIPYTGNELIKNDLDKMAKMLLEQRMSNGPFRFVDQGMSGDDLQNIDGITSFVRDKSDYKKLKKE
jgi:hypothetical protein